jgi:RecJ-like exonuclease
MKQFIKECTTCEGTGIQGRNNSCDNHPSRDEVWACDYCEEGKVHDQDALDEAIMDAQDMIDGMITRIRLTSDTLKDLSRGMFYELLPKYKHRLQIQARALARLEMYKANLQNL